jgi:hypothetical protein
MQGRDQPLQSAIVAISMASQRRSPRPLSRSPFSPFPARHPQTQRALVRGDQTAATAHGGRIERHAARGEGGEWAPATSRRLKQEARERQVMRS